MATQLGENTKVTLDLKTIGMVVVGAVSLAAMYFTLKKDIELAKELPDAPQRKSALNMLGISSPLDKRGLWDNIHAKRKRGEAPNKPGDKGYPTEKALKDSQ